MSLPRNATSSDRSKNKNHTEKRQNEENKLAVKNENMRNELKKRISHTSTEVAGRRREEADRLRQEKKEQEELVEMYRQQEQLRNTSMKQMIRNNEKDLEEKRQRDYAEKKVSKTKINAISYLIHLLGKSKIEFR